MRAILVCLLALACSDGEDPRVVTRSLGPPRPRQPLATLTPSDVIPPYPYPLYTYPRPRNLRPDEVVRNPDVRPVRIAGEPPKYPAVAKKARIAGVVIVEMIIERDGHVGQAIILKPLPFGLDEAALDAVRTWRYRPGMIGGRPVRTIWDEAIPMRPPPD